MKSYLKAALVAATCLSVSTAVSAGTKVIHAGTLLAVPGEAPKSQQTLVVGEDGRITEVRDGYVDASEFGDDAVAIDLKSSFVMPGLMDMHVHLQGELGPRAAMDRFTKSRQLQGIRAQQYAMRTLNAGFTTVRDTGSDEQYMYALRDAINSGWVDGPRIVAAGGVGITGGHGDVSGSRPEIMHMSTNENVCNGPYDCRRAARNTIKFGADLIKVAATGGVLTDRATGTGQQMQSDELKEIVQAAKTMGRKVIAHAHQEDGIIAALNAGVASIEHGTYVGPEGIKLFKETGAYLVPTLIAGDTVKKMAETSNFMSPAIKQKSIEVGTAMKANFAKAYKAGVKIAYGTDSGVSKHGTNAQEAVLMHEAGMPVMDIIKSATVNAADLVDMSDSLGTLEAGKYADIIATDGNVLDDVTELLDVDFVMKGGKVFKD